MPLPKVLYCIACEGVRSEERRKATILGFFNIFPWVEIGVPAWGTPISTLMFLFGTTGGTGKGNFQLTVVNPDGTPLVKTPEVTVVFPEGVVDLNVGIAVGNLVFTAPGAYTLELRVSGQESFRDTFKVRLDPPSQS